MKLIPHLHIHFLGKTVNAFHYFGILGYVAGVGLGLTLAWQTAISPWPILLCSLIGAGVLLGLTMLYKILTGKETLVYYQHEIAILFCCWLMLKFLGLPLLPYLDITLLGVGTFMAFGRWGCFSVGCCHGRPARVGVVYGPAHVEAGFPHYYQGLKIFPIPLVESALVFATVAIGSLAILKASPAGTALILYTLIYGIARFFLEFFRGDPARPYWLGLSEAQWTTLVLLVFSAYGAYAGLLPFYTWHLYGVAALCFFVLMLALYRNRQKIPFHRVLAPRHIAEIAHCLDELAHVDINEQEAVKIPVVHTSQGLKISVGQYQGDQGEVRHYAISTNEELGWKGEGLNLRLAHQVAHLLTEFRHQFDNYKIVKGSTGLYHILFPLSNSRKI